MTPGMLCCKAEIVATGGGGGGRGGEGLTGLIQ